MLEVGAPQGWGPSRLSSSQLAEVLAALQQAAAKGGADTTVLRQGSTEMAAEGEGGESGVCCLAAPCAVNATPVCACGSSMCTIQ